MLKMNAAFSKKVPVEGQEFSSQSYHASIELELSDALKAEELAGRIHSTFATVRQAVEDELSGKVSLPAVVPMPPAVNTTTAKGNGKKITNSQAKFALDISRKNHLTLADLDEFIKHEFGAPGLYDLTAAQGSQLIDLLKVQKAA